MEIKMENLNGMVLKIAGKRTSEDITITTGLDKYSGSTTVNITDKAGLTLNTAGKYFEEDITVTLDESMFVTGYTVTLVDSSYSYVPVTSTGSKYSIDGGATWNEITTLPLTIKNVEKIRFRNGSLHFLCVSDAVMLNSYDESTDITLTADATWSVHFENQGGGSSN